MKVSTTLRMASAIVVLGLSGSALPGSAPPTSEAAGLLERDVIVVMRDQMPGLPGVRGQREARTAALAGSQAPIVSHLKASGASRIHGFSLINAVSAHVSAAEADQLAAHPLVQAVVPVMTLKLPRHTNDSLAGSSAGAAAAPAAVGSAAVDPALCNTLEPEALQLTNTAFLDPSTPQAQLVRDGNGAFVTGKGVKVAWIADGLDPTIKGFIHTDGTPVFIDYQDFSGDPAGTPTDAGEAFGDASSIAAQDTPNGKPLFFALNQFVDTALHTLPPGVCQIRIRGMAPGASLVGLKAFSAIGITTNSAIVQAIEYAVLHDDVDVINESFGSNPFPDNDNDVVTLADEAAVRAGVTVVASTGDAGFNGTMGAPSTDSAVISAGATTQLRLYAQVGEGASHFASHDGFVDNNLSAFSSGGFSISGPRTPDVVAPGDLGWALCSTNSTLFVGCVNVSTSTTPTPQPIEIFGGTSESSPLTAGEAALVIQAYRSTHHGADPTPALVKRIIMSTATDLGAPPSEQGAGLINALAAVQAALSVADEHGSPARTGSSLVSNPTIASVVDRPTAPETLAFAITNTGSVTQHLVPALQALGPPVAGATTVVNLNRSLPAFPSQAGLPRYFVLQHFNVPAGVDHLDTAIAWQAPFFGAAVTADLGLIDPSGRNVGYTIPQGSSSGFGHFDVNHPAAGTWTAVIWTSAVSATYVGPVQFSWSAENYVSFGSVSPASFNLAPGATQFVTARFLMPAEPGDQGVAIRFGSGRSEIPIALRTLIPTGPGGGSFVGTLTGGNGRPGAGPTQTYAFDVPAGLRSMSLSLQIPDNLYLLEGVLVDPNGMQLSVEPNVDANGFSSFSMELNRASPAPGRWRFVLLLNFFTSGNELALPFTAQINFNSAEVTAPGLPNNPAIRLSASGAPLVVPVRITNNAGLAQAFFADARLNTLAALPLPTFVAATTCGPATLPFACFGTILPTQVHSVAFLAQATARINMDVAGNTGYLVGFTGAPDIGARPVAPDTVAASLTEPEVPFGEWLMFPALVGPFGKAGAPTTPVTTTVLAQLKAFDGAVSSDVGDLWSDLTLGTSTFTGGLVLAPAATGTIHVTIKPNPALVGTTVHGFLYIDTYNAINAPLNTLPGLSFLGDEVIAIPYSYTVTK
jgi:subtilase family protein